MSPNPVLISGGANTSGSNLKKEVVELRSKFKAFWPEILEGITQDSSMQEYPYAAEWLQNVLSKNVPQGKLNRGLIVCSVYNKIVGGNANEEDTRLALIAGWTIEICQAAAIMADDIMDESETRRGNTCWYKRGDVGLSAVNDSFMLENIAYFVLYKYFTEKEYFNRFMRHIHDSILKTIFGQCMDTRTSLNFNLKNCTMDAYRQIVTYKTSYYTFYSPIATAMIIASIKDERLFSAVKSVTFAMGFLFQVQDDYFDCFGDPRITGKVGTDIVDGKCTWLLVKALEFANDAQRAILEVNYGKKAEEAESNVKEVYGELGLKRMLLDKLHPPRLQSCAKFDGL